jgi:hypothetical protein
MAAATSAPLNPAYRAREFEFFLSDLSARAVIVPDGVDSPAREVARALGIQLMELSRVSGALAGVFTLGESR